MSAELGNGRGGRRKIPAPQLVCSRENVNDFFSGNRRF